MAKESSSLDILGTKPIADSINTVTKGSVEGASAFLSRICLPAAEEFGLLLKDKVSVWRANNVVKIANKTQELLEQNSKENVSAHPRIAYSTIENGSWAEDDVMQKIWAGLLASSCTTDGKDESNHLLISIMSQLISSQAKLINYICKNSPTYKSSMGWIYSEDFTLNSHELTEIMGIDDIHQLDRELDHLRSLDLIIGGFNLYSKNTDADVTPTPLCLQLYVRGQGYVGSPSEYFNSPEKEKIDTVKKAYEDAFER